ncbi:MAG: aminopeptidase P family protein, partial [Actinobacteria bacterium]|nr:aminopeptidase P family protein [Actinomycetota bacterium]
MELELLTRLRQAMHDDDVAAMIITPGADLQYIAGYDAKPL